MSSMIASGSWSVKKVEEVFMVPTALTTPPPVAGHPRLPLKYDGASLVGCSRVGESLEWKYFFYLGNQVSGPRYLMILIAGRGYIDHPNLPPCFAAREGRD